MKKRIHFNFFFLRNVSKVMALESRDGLDLKSTHCPFTTIETVLLPQLNFWKTREMLEICEIQGDCLFIFLLFLGEFSGEQLRELLHQVLLLSSLAGRSF